MLNYQRVRLIEVKMNHNLGMTFDEISPDEPPSSYFTFKEYPPIIKHGNESNIIIGFFPIQPSFNLRICQLAMFGDTGGYSFFQESWSLPFAQLTACWMLQPEVERTSGCWCPLRSLPAKLSPHTWFLQWLRALLLLFYCLYIYIHT